MRNYIAICYKAKGTVLEQDCNKLTAFPDSLFLKENFDHHVLHIMEMLSLSNIEHKCCGLFTCVSVIFWKVVQDQPPIDFLCNIQFSLHFTSKLKKFGRVFSTSHSCFLFHAPLVLHLFYGYTQETEVICINFTVKNIHSLNCSTLFHC